MLTVLAGGVGAAKFLTGLANIVPQKNLSIIVNTGDDIEINSLNISPDLDIITYTLAGIVDETKGWGIKNDSFNCLNAIKKFKGETWFKTGDCDLATHIYRTAKLKSGTKLSEVTSEIKTAFGVKANILPMTDDFVETRIITPKGNLHFEEFLVRNNSSDDILNIKFSGIEKAKPAKGVIEAIKKAKKIIICPSNPIVSIGTILSINGIRECIKKSKAKKIAISPIINGRPVKGPADKMMRGLGFEVSVFSIANMYKDFLDSFIIDKSDIKEKIKIEKLGIKVKVTNILMKRYSDKIHLAKTALED